MITVHGYLGAVDVALCELAVTSDLVVAPGRVLDAMAVPAQRRLVLGSVGLVLETLRTVDPELDVRVLASGDPLFFGLVRRLRLAGLPTRAVPGVSSVAAAFAAVALPWDDAVVASAHGRELGPALAACRARPKVAVLTAPGAGGVELSDGLADLTRWYVVAERLGEPAERVRVFDGPSLRAATDLTDPHVVLVLAHPVGDPGAVGPSVSFAGGVVTQPGRRPADPPVSLVAAAVFGRLMPGLGDAVAVAGTAGQEVGVLAARAGAAVLPLGEQVRSGPLRPAYVVCDLGAGADPRPWLDLATRATVLVSDAAPDARTGRGAAERIDVTGPDGRTGTSYLTFLPAEENDPADPSIHAVDPGANP